MAKIFLALFFVATAQAQLFKSEEKSPGTETAETAIKSLSELKTDQPDFEEKFRRQLVEVERLVELMKSECQEKTVDAEKKRCFRDLVGLQRKYFENSFELKRGYLKKIHEDQLNTLEKSRREALDSLDKFF